MHLGKSNRNHKYKISDTDIENVTHEKDLGVFFDQDLKFNQHIGLKVKKANQALGMIRKTFTNLDKDLFLTLYKSYGRPNLE